MINYFLEKPKSEAKRISLKRRMVAMVVGLVLTAGVYGVFLYSMHDVVQPDTTPAIGVTMDQKQLVWDYVTDNAPELLKKQLPEDVLIQMSRVHFEDEDTAIVRFTDGALFYEAELTVAFEQDATTGKEKVVVSTFDVVRESEQSLE